MTRPKLINVIHNCGHVLRDVPVLSCVPALWGRLRYLPTANLASALPAAPPVRQGK